MIHLKFIILVSETWEKDCYDLLTENLKWELTANFKEIFGYLFQKLCDDVQKCVKDEPKLQTPEIAAAIQNFYDLMHTNIKIARTIAQRSANLIIVNTIGLMRSGFEEKKMFLHQSPETKDIGTDVPEFLFADFPLPKEKINWMIRPKKRS